MSQVNFLLSQLRLGEFKTWRDRVQVKKGEITRGKMTLYTVSSFLIKLKTQPFLCLEHKRPYARQNKLSNINILSFNSLQEAH